MSLLEHQGGSVPAVRLLTPRSIGIGVGSGFLVAVGYGQFYGVALGLAVLDGLAAGALALATSICLRDGRFAGLMETGRDRRRDVGVVLACAVVAPAIFIEDALGIELLDRGYGSALSLLFACTGSAACTLSGIMSIWAPSDGNVGAAGPRLHRVVPPYGGHGAGKPRRAFRAQPYAIAMATGVLVAIVLRQFLDLAWGLAILNGLAAGGLALVLSIGGDLAGGWFDATDNRSRSGVRGLTCTVMVAPALLVHRYIELRPAAEVAVSLLFMLTAAAAYVLGRVMAALEHLDGDRSVPVDPRLNRVTPPRGGDDGRREQGR